ncbi:SRPBCC family protein [Streptomyces gobiensis]|uniref:SRPBCC family protein n=1 Tax=Streptomyces gobiensis TaxID=2875706 RepID=UPI001E3E07BE|nr:SRPBCC family protein [Streptomyces gobiensis]UGY94264.1 SRPBCC family protein [Streptomyces gobiensis]
METAQVVVERRIAASADEVWRVLTDLKALPRVLSGVERVEVLTKGPFGVGTGWRETRRMFGRTVTEDMRVTVCEEPSRYVLGTESGGAHYFSEVTLTPQGAGATVVRRSFGARQQGGFSGLLAKAFTGLGGRAVAKTLERDLADIAIRVTRVT